MNKEKRLELIKNDLINSSNILNILSDFNRQKILLVLLDNCTTGDIRVQDIAKRVNLSRPAVSHQLKLLLDSGFVSVVKDGTKNYYHISGIDQMMSLKSLLNNIELYLDERKED